MTPSGSNPLGAADGARTVDLLVSGGDVVTMNPDREVLVGGTVAIAGKRIAAVGSTRTRR
jgi:predicted amidohydrolase YtcJ